MTDSTREILATALAPLAPTALVIVVPILLTSSIPSAQELLLLSIPSVICSYLAFLLLGLPLISALRRRGKLNAVSLMAGGAVLGSIAGVLIIAGFALLLGSPLSGGSDAAAGHLLTVLWGGGLGLSVAVAYGVIAGWPNNSFKPNPLRRFVD